MTERTCNILKNGEPGTGGMSSVFAPVPIIIKSGELVVITGPNGTGKSALLDEIAQSLGGAPDVERLTGYRQIHFPDGDVDQTGNLQVLQQNLNSPGAVNRHRNPWSELHLQSFIRRILDHQSQANQDIIEKQTAGLTLAQAVQMHPRVIDTINNVFTSALMPVQFILQFCAPNGVNQYTTLIAFPMANAPPCYSLVPSRSDQRIASLLSMSRNAISIPASADDS